MTNDSRFKGHPDYSANAPYMQDTMRNPSRPAWFPLVLGILFGFTLAVIPGIIRIKQMRSDFQVTLDGTHKEMAELQGKLKNLVDYDMMRDQNAIDRSKFHTLLISSAGVQPHRELTGIEDPWSHIDVSYMPGTIWVLPGVIQPSTLNADQRAAWAVVSPDGHAGKWLQAGVNSGIGNP